MPYTNALTSPVFNSGWYGDSERYSVMQAAPITATGSSNNYLSLGFKLPARCQIVWASLANGSTMAYTGNDGTNSASCYALVCNTQSTMATGSTAATATNIILRGGTSLTAGDVVFRGPATNTAAVANTTSSDQWLFIMPASTATGTAAVIYNTGTGTSTAGYKFTATGNINVRVAFATYQDVATNTAA